MVAERCLNDAQIRIEVAYAHPEKQRLVTLVVAQGTTARDALKWSGLDQHFPELTAKEMDSVALGIFGQRLRDPEHYELGDGDRLEVYRDLLCDPKQARIARARDKQ